LDPAWLMRQWLLRGIHYLAPDPLVSWAPFFYHHDLSSAIEIKSHCYALSIKYVEKTDRAILEKMPELQLHQTQARPMPAFISQAGTPSLTVDYQQFSDKTSQSVSAFSYAIANQTQTQQVGALMIQNQSGIKHVILKQEGVIESLPPISIHTSSSYLNYVHLATQFRTIRLDKEKYQLLKTALTTLVPDLIEVYIEYYDGFPMFYIRLTGSDTSYPLSQFGSAVTKVLSWGLTIMQTHVKILLIDEIENTLHYARQEAVFQALFAMASAFDCQIIANTHSYECLQSIHRILLNEEKFQEDFTYIKLKKLPQAIEPVIGEFSTFSRLIEYDAEIR
ncbi:MAG: AAA family ATPase, partial [Gammaproteobacteria bacterium]|nr:AAA family ATPase [Gammaproteobacteria bacterium]